MSLKLRRAIPLRARKKMMIWRPRVRTINVVLLDESRGSIRVTTSQESEAMARITWRTQSKSAKVDEGYQEEALG
jgi:hypothetical protein